MEHKPVETSDYYAALSQSGLQLAEGQARQYLAEARQDSEKPARDVAHGLATIARLQQTQEVTA